MRAICADVIPGGKYGRLTVVTISAARRAVCKCDCGAMSEVGLRDLVTGNTKSCGCLKLDMLMAHSRTHGEGAYKRRTPEHIAWQNMIARCKYPNHPSWKRYGARGITVCEKWISSYESFLSDVGRRPSALHSLERVRTDGNYEPGNVIWATSHEQQRNTSRNVLLEIDGRRMCLRDWAALSSVVEDAIKMRLNRGWSHKDAVFLPKYFNKRSVDLSIVA